MHIFGLFLEGYDSPKWRRTSACETPLVKIPALSEGLSALTLSHNPLERRANP